MVEKVFRLLAAIVAVSSIAIPGIAQQITLQATDGSVSVNGELVSYDGEFFLIKTRLGDIALNARDVICIGETCPEITGDDGLSITGDVGFSIAGSNTIGQKLMPNLLAEYARLNDLSLTESVVILSGGNQPTNRTEYVFEDSSETTVAEISIESNGADSAFGALLNGSAEIVMSSRAIRPAEVQAFLSVGLGDISTSENQTIVALDGMIIVVSQDNPVLALSIAEIARIFSGQATNWQEFGGPDQTIYLYRRGEEAGITSDFHLNVLAPQQFDYSDFAEILFSDSEISQMVSQDPYGIGIVSFAFENNARALALRDTCGFPMLPTEFNIKTGEYPLSRQLYLYSSAQNIAGYSESRAEQLNGFLEFVRSDAANRAVSDAGFVGQNIVGLSIESQGQRLANALSNDLGDASFSELRSLALQLRDAQRLSTTFRILDGNPVIDADNIHRIERLAEYLSDLELTGKEVVFAGFTASFGDADANSTLALQRADRAMKLVQAKLGLSAQNISMVATGFGEIAPLACNDSVFGRAVNHRVEVWVRDRLSN